MIVQEATKRTFYIERHGTEYKLIKVWEPGVELKQQDMQECFLRVMETSPDERIIAEQQIGISVNEGKIKVVAADKATLDATKKATEEILKDELD